MLEGAEPGVTSDVYALASVLSTMLAGEPAHLAAAWAGPATLIQRTLEQAPPTLSRPDVPAGLLPVIRRGMAPDPAGRYGSAAEFAAALRDLDAGPYEVPEPPGLSRAPEPPDAFTPPGAETVVSSPDGGEIIGSAPPGLDVETGAERPGGQRVLVVAAAAVAIVAITGVIGLVGRGRPDPEAAPSRVTPRAAVSHPGPTATRQAPALSKLELTRYQPTALKAVPAPQQVVLTWRLPADARRDGDGIIRLQPADDAPVAARSRTSGRLEETYVAVPLKPGQQYCFLVGVLLQRTGARSPSPDRSARCPADRPVRPWARTGVRPARPRGCLGHSEAWTMDGRRRTEVVSGVMPGGELNLDVTLSRLMPRVAKSFPRQLSLTFKLVTRLFEAMVALQAGFDRGWPLALAALGCAVLDIVLAPILSEPGKRMVPRVALDMADVALWSLALPGAADVAVVAGSPVVLEAGFWYGARGLVVPFLIGGAATAAVTAAGRFTLLPLLWPAFAALGGRLVRAYLLVRWREEARVMRHHVEAAVSQAELAGQNSVAMGADSVVDLLVRTAPLIARYEPAPIPGPFAGWKAALAEACGRQSTYLGVALRRWQRLYNARSPDLSTDVELRVTPGAGTLLLSPGQARDLEDRLDAMGLRGLVTVDAPRLSAPGQRQQVLVDGRPLTIPADPRPRTWPITAAPIAFAGGAMIVLTQSVPEWEAIPLWLTGPIAALNLLAAWWAHRNAGRGPREVANRVIPVALLLALLQSVVTSAAMRAGSDRLPFLFFLHWVGPLVYVHARDLRRSRLPLLLAGLLAAALAGAVAMPVSFPLIDPFIGLFWFLPPLLTIKGIRNILDQDVEDMGTQHAHLHDEAVRDGFRRGRLLVVDLTTDAVDQLRGRYRALGNAVPRHMGEEIERRLEEAGTMLAAAASD